MPEPDKAAGIDFLDFFFTFIVGIGLAPEAVGGAGLLSEEWFKRGGFPSGAKLFDFAVFVLGVLTLVMSWYGYHASIQKKPLTYGTWSGMGRFVIDVFLVMIYGVILLQFKNFHAVLFLIAVSFLLFVIWDIIKVVEHWKEYNKDTTLTRVQKFRRELVTGLWTMCSFSLVVVQSVYQNCNWPILFCAIGIIFLYRVHKEVHIIF